MRRDDLELFRPDGGESPLERADRLLELGARLSQEGDRLSAAAVFAEAADCYQQVGYHEAQAHALRRRGSALFNAERHEESAEVYLQAVEVASAIPDMGLVHVARWGAADGFAALGDWKNALAQAEASLLVGRTYGFDECEAAAEFIRGRALYWLDREEESLESLARARNIFRGQGDGDRVSAVDSFSVTVLLFLGRVGEATEAARRCLRFWQGMDNEVEVAFAHRELGHCLARAKDYQSAITSFESSKRLYLRNRMPAAAALSDLGVARALRDSDQLDEAIEVYTGAIAVLEASGFDGDRQDAQHELSTVLVWTGRFAESIAIDRNLIAECGSEGEFTPALVTVVDRCIWTYLLQGENAGASALFDEVVDAVAWTQDGNPLRWFSLRSMYAWALWQQNLGDLAFNIVGELIDHPAMTEVGMNQARILEIVGHVDDAELSFKSRARAMAMYLQVGDEESAKVLAEDVLRQSA